MAEFTLLALYNEIENDPQSIGYKESNGDWKEDAVIVGLINDPENGATITRKLIQRNEIIYGFEVGELFQIADDTPPPGALSDTERWYLSMLLREQEVDANDEEVFSALLALFPSEAARPNFRGGTRANIQETLQKQGSRAEVLWGEGKIVTISEVAHAANEG